MNGRYRFPHVFLEDTHPEVTTDVNENGQAWASLYEPFMTFLNESDPSPRTNGLPKWVCVGYDPTIFFCRLSYNGLGQIVYSNQMSIHPSVLYMILSALGKAPTIPDKWFSRFVPNYGDKLQVPQSGQ